MNECKFNEIGQSLLRYIALISGQSTLLLVRIFSFLYSLICIELQLDARCHTLHSSEQKCTILALMELPV